MALKKLELDMVLKKLESGSEYKCVCGSCNGTGIYKGYAEHSGLGVICMDCNGTGYKNLKIDGSKDFVLDEKARAIYLVKDDIIVIFARLFDKRQLRDDVSYVMYGTGRFFSPEYLFNHGASEINVITYDEFLKGIYPLPVAKYICPRQLSQSYGDGSFDNDCTVGYFSDCPRFGTMECWNVFYGNAKTISERQDLLKKIRRR